MHAAAFKLCKALRLRTPAVYYSDGVAKSWLKKYSTELRFINTAGHLELICGARIREEGMALLQAPELEL